MWLMELNFHQPSQTINIRSNYLEKIMNDRFESLESGEVVSVQHDAQVLSGHRTFRVGELSNAIESHLEKAIADWNEEKKAWFSDRGIDCEALRFGSNGWQKGRIRLCLEFCPDEPNPQAQSASNSIPTTHANPEIAGTANTSLQLSSSSDPTPHLHHQHTESTANTTELSPAADLDDRQQISTAVPVDRDLASDRTDGDLLKNIAIPVAGIATIGTVAAAAAIATESTNLDRSPLVDTILELEEHPGDRHTPHQSFDEIAFDFDVVNRDLASDSSHGMMELDLTDLGLDFTEQDLLSFEANGLSDSSEEFANFQDLGQPENSGMLIDEVWNEMNQGNWPGIN
jgi:KGK domain